MGAQSELSQKNAVDYHFSQYRMLDMASGPTTVLSGFENESVPALQSIHSASQHLQQQLAQQNGKASSSLKGQFSPKQQKKAQFYLT